MSSKNGSKSKPKKEKQVELPGMASPAIRGKILRAKEIKEEIGSRQAELKEALDDVRKVMKDEGKKKLMCEDDNGDPFEVRLVPTGEKVTFAKAKKKKIKDDPEGKSLESELVPA